MSNPSQVESIFSSALEKKNAAERAEYLDQACGADAALRRRVERLLEAHPHAVDYLARPAVNRQEFDPHNEPEDLAGIAPVAVTDPSQPTSAETLRGTATSASGSPPGTARLTGEAAPDGALSPAVGAPPAGRLDGFVPGQVIAGRYTLLEVLGEGGMGTVYRADQTEPVKRQVAVKLIKAGMDSRTVLACFDAERQALALMDHPNIARVYDGGTTATGQPFFVMDLVIGTPITEYCDSRRIPVGRRLELFVAVCEAVQHAHQKGMIHRDLKPGNVLVTEVDGRPTPKIIDFGVAKATEFNLTDQSLADTGAIVGTPAYMSPEQADPSSMDIDTRTDVYALGVILYELLAGSPPFEAKQFKRGAILEMLRLVHEVDPPKPSTKLSTAEALPSIAASRDIDPAHLKRALKGDLDWVVMKAMEKDRTRRYETANGFATDVLRYLAYEPVLAAPPSRTYRLRKLVRKHRGAVLAASLVVLALLAGIAGTTWGLIEARRQEGIARRETSEKEIARQAEARRAEGERLATRKALAATVAEKKAKETAQSSFAKARKAEKEATEQRNRADHEAEVAQQNLYYAQMHLALPAWREHRGLPHMRELLTNWLPRGESPDRRGWEWFYLNALPYQNLRTLTEGGRNNRPSTVVWHLASQRLAEGTSEGLIRIWDVDRERTPLIVTGPAPVAPWWGVRWFGWSPDGGRLASGCKDGTVHVWETGSGRELMVLLGHKSPVWSVAFSSDGTRVAAWGEDGTIKIWDAKTGRLTADVAHPGGVTAGAWSPDDKLLASGTGDGTITLSGTRAGDKIVTLQGHADMVYHLAWSPDGVRLASSSGDFTALIWDVAAQKVVLGPLRHSHGITAATWEPDGRRLATSSMDQTVKIWDATTGREDVTLRGYDDAITSLSWGTGDRLASGGGDGSMRIWNSIRDQESSALSGHVVRATSVSWSPDGKRLASGGDDGKVRIWDPATRKETLALNGHDGARVAPQFGLIRSLAWSPDGTHLASAGLDGTAKVWEVAGGREIFALPADRGSIWSVAWSLNGTHLGVGSEDGTIRVVEGFKHTPRVHSFPAHSGRVRSLAWSPQGDRLASVGGDGLVKLWDPIRGAEQARMQGHVGWVMGVAWSPDGTRLASAGADSLVIAWDAETGRKLSTMRGHNDFVDAVVWSPDGTRLASAGLDNSVRVWDPRTGAETFVLRGSSGMFHDVSWNPDGARLAAASSDGQIWIWDATRGFERDTTSRALPYIDRAVASETARGADLFWYVQSYARAGKPREALVAVKDDPYGLCKLARHFDAQDNAPWAGEARTRARALLEQQLAAEPDNEATAAELADLMLIDSTAWTVLQPTEMKSERGATLTRLDDGSILASGINADGDVYKITAVGNLDRIAAVRLEALPDPSLPNQGPGRHESGNFHLSAFRLRLPTGAGVSDLTPLPIEHAWASFEYKAPDAAIAGTIDERLKKVWHVWGRLGEAQEAVFLVRGTPAVGRGRPIAIELRHHFNLGRFRLSVSGAPSILVREGRCFSARKLTDPWARLAAAYQIVGDHQSLDKLLERHRAAAVGIGDMYAADQDWDRAIAEYRKVVNDQTADGNLSAKLATAYQAAGRTREAVPHLSKASSANPQDTILSLKVAALQAWFGQEKEYAATRQRILASAMGTNEATTAERAVKACSILPLTVKAELEAVLGSRRTAMKTGHSEEWDLLALGMAEYRSGNDSATAEALRAAAEAGKNNPFVTGTSAFYRAMSLYRQGKPDEARKFATAAATKMKSLPADEQNPLAGDASHDDLILWLAYKEAKALIKFDGSPADPAPCDGQRRFPPAEIGVELKP